MSHQRSLRRSSRACVFAAAFLIAKSSVATAQDDFNLRETSSSKSVYVEEEYDDTSREERFAGTQVLGPTVDQSGSIGELGPAPDKDAEAEKKKAAAEKKKKEELKKKVATAYKDPFFLNDFSYLSNPNYKGSNLGEGMRRDQADPNWRER